MSCFGGYQITRHPFQFVVWRTVFFRVVNATLSDMKNARPAYDGYEKLLLQASQVHILQAKVIIIFVVIAEMFCAFLEGTPGGFIEWHSHVMLWRLPWKSIQNIKRFFIYRLLVCAFEILRIFVSALKLDLSRQQPRLMMLQAAHVSKDLFCMSFSTWIKSSAT